MKAAYRQGPSTLLEETFRKNVEETLALMSMDEFQVAIKQILLYIKSTVENFGTVRESTSRVAFQCISKFKNIHSTSCFFRRSSPKTRALTF